MDERCRSCQLVDIRLETENCLSIRDNGQGIPVDPHPKFPNKSALEVILTTLHAGRKFSGKAYQTSGVGVGASVVNALSTMLEVEVARDKTLYRQVFSRGKAEGGLTVVGARQSSRHAYPPAR